MEAVTETPQVASLNDDTIFIREDVDEAAIEAALAREAALRDALIAATAALAGSASAYRRYAKRHKSRGIAETDALFSTRADDFDKAVKAARAALEVKQ